MLDTSFYCAAGQIKTPALLFDRLRNAIPASAPFVALQGFPQVINLRSSTKQIRKQNRERCSFPRSPWLSTSNGLEKFHGAKCICVKCYLQRLISMI